MLSRSRNLRKIDGIAIAQLHSWSSVAQRIVKSFKLIKPFMERLGKYLDISLISPLSLQAGRSRREERKEFADPYYVGYHNLADAQHRDTPSDSLFPSEAGAKSYVENQNPSDPDYVHYYSNVALTSDFVLFSQEGENSEIEQQWKGEIERYIKIGGKKENFIDFINAAKTGFPDERSKEANDKVKLFREDFIKKASKEDIVHIMKLHENIRLKLEQSKSNYLAKGNKRAYQECSGRISRLYRGNQQLQLVLKRKSRVFAS